MWRNATGPGCSAMNHGSVSSNQPTDELGAVDLGQAV